ncbi:hypothetical protein QYE76_002564 [Lolium multiflorum]|uniref:Uncharacterized protein n=1 Tax=Lolium multiflorum TaxID=4521 RepID=A0AAD8VZM7_LOLMU|nr:hypothetical protein QYE76_002564 [Lolium multiflorum]
MDMKLDMELDMKTSHGGAREEREECARGRAKSRPVPDPARPAVPPDHRSQCDPTGSGRGAPGPNRPWRLCHPGTIHDAKLVNQKDKDAADLMTWRDFEALRNEMRREFRIEDDELRGTVEEIKQKLDATNETVTGLADQMTDIQRSLRTLTMSVENLTNQQQQQAEDADDAPGRGD